ncbi:MAG: leucine-rich repeat protein [Oscillospiraceae bacterium]|nr:leucine-rich repeat protein [Oscillospiraceae bacterium]
MRKTRTALRFAAFAAALALTAGVPVAAQNSVYSGAGLTAQAAIEDGPYTEGSVGDLYYIKYEDHASISGCKAGVSAVEIPDSIEGVPVTYIDDYAFDCSDVTSVSIPAGITSIGNYAFSYCFNLKSVSLPDSIEAIGIKAFENCKSLETVEFPDHLVKVRSHAFMSTPWLEAQQKKNPLVIVNGALIDGTTYAESELVIPSEVTYIASSAFDRNTTITSVVIPASVKSVSDNTFWMCENLESCEIRGAETIESMAFGYCEKLKDLKVSNKLKTIENYGFNECSGNGATITFYGSEAQWNAVEKLDTGDFLKNARVVFDEGGLPEDPDPQTVEGDVDGDGALSAADLVALQKWLLAVPGATLKNNDAADMDKNDIIDIFDLGLLKRALLNK